MVALLNRADHYIFMLFLLSSFLWFIFLWMQLSIFWGRHVLSDRCPVCLCCPVCNVGVPDIVPNGWMDKDATCYGDRPQPWRHCVRWVPQLPPRKGAQFVYAVSAIFLLPLSTYALVGRLITVLQSLAPDITCVNHYCGVRR